MLENFNKPDDKAVDFAMDDGGRCLLDVINDPQLLQSFLESSNLTSNNDGTSTNSQTISANAKVTNSKSEVKAKKSNITATKSNPLVQNFNNEKTLNSTPTNVNTQPTLQSSLMGSSVGILPMAISSVSGGLSVNAQSISQTITTSTVNTNQAQTSTVMPQLQMGSRTMTVVPQQILVPGVNALGQTNSIPQIVLTKPPAPAIQSGQVLQLIQTSQCAQLVPNSSSIQTVVTTTHSNVKCTNSNSRSNKQILPKIQGSCATTPSTPSRASGQGGKLVNSAFQPNISSSSTTLTSQSLNSVNSASQILIGSGAQQSGIISTSQGTFLLNGLLPNFSSQPILFQQNVQNSSLQLAIRPQGPLIVNNNTLTNDQTGIGLTIPGTQQIINGEQNTSQSSQPFMLSNNASIRPTSSNILIRPQLISAPAPPPPPQQFLQLQTANGPILVALNLTSQQPQVATQQIIQPQQNTNVQPSAIQIGNTVFSLAANPQLNLQTGAQLQTILTQTPNNTSIPNSGLAQTNTAISSSTAAPLILNSPQSLQNNTQPTKANSTNVVGNQEPSKSKTSKGLLDLTDLLKETGILTDFSPQSSPKSNAETSLFNSVQQQEIQPNNGIQQSNASMIPSALNVSSNALSQNIPSSQLRISLASDGSLMLMSPVSNSSQVKPIIDSSGPGSSQPSPDSTTPSFEPSASSASVSVSQNTTVASFPSTSQKERKTKENTKKGSGSQVPSQSLNQSISSVKPSTSCKSSVAVVSATFTSVPSCAAVTTIAVTTPVASTSSSTTPVRYSPVLRLTDHKGTILPDIGPNNKEFAAKLESQLASLNAIKNLVPAQKEVQMELLNLQHRFNMLKSPSMQYAIVQMHISQAVQQLLNLTPFSPQTQIVKNVFVSSNTNKHNSQIQQIPMAVSSVIPSTSVVVPKTTDISFTTPQQTSTFTSTKNQSVSGTKPAKQVPLVFKAIQQQLKADQNTALRPDCRNQFRSCDDACKRMLRFHIFNSTTSRCEIDKFDTEFEEYSKWLIYKKSQLRSKFSYLLTLESVKMAPTSEEVMLNRLFINEESEALKNDKDYVASGNDLDLPPFPQSWLSSDQEVASGENCGLKRKSDLERQDEELHSGSIGETPNKRRECEYDKSSDDLFLLSQLSDDRNEMANVDDLIQQLNSPQEATLNENISTLNNDSRNFLDNLEDVPSSQNFLDSTSNSLITDDLDELYSGFAANDLADQSWSSNVHRTASHNTLISNHNDNNSAMSWNARFCVTEADVAVQSIIDATNNPVDEIDFSGLDDLNHGLVDEVNFEVGDGDNVMMENAGNQSANDFLNSGSIAQTNFDEQMNSAIKSIMVPSPPGQMSDNSSNYHSTQSSYHHISNNSMRNTNYSNVAYHQNSSPMLPSHMSMRPNMIAFPASVVNDPMLDEAVKSIL